MVDTDRVKTMMGAEGVARRAVYALAACVAAIAVAACGGSGSTQVAGLSVGALVAQTGAGAPIGTEQLQAIRLAVDRINAAGGVGGTKLNLLVVDSRSNPVDATAGMRSLIGQGVVAVLGPTLSLSAVGADPVANQLHTPVISISNTAPGIVGRCAYACEWIWRDSLGTLRTTTANVQTLLKDQAVSSAALLSSSSDILAAAESATAAAAFRAGGTRIAANVKLPPPGGNPSSVAHDVAVALRSRPDALFVSSSDGNEVAQVVRLARADGFRGQILAGDVLNASAATRVAGGADRGVQTGAAWYVGNDFPANISFVRTFAGAYGDEPDQFAAQAYVGIQILTQAIVRGGARGGGLTVAQRRSAVQKGLGQVALTTPLGPFRFTASQDVDQIAWIIQGDGRGGHRLVAFCNPGC